MNDFEQWWERFISCTGPDGIPKTYKELMENSSEGIGSFKIIAQAAWDAGAYAVTLAVKDSIVEALGGFVKGNKGG